MSDPPPGESLGARYGDKRLDHQVRHLAGGGAVMELFKVKEEGDTISIRCQVCEMTLYGLRTLNYHIAGKKHEAKFSSRVRNKFLKQIILKTDFICLELGNCRASLFNLLNNHSNRCHAQFARSSECCVK